MGDYPAGYSEPASADDIHYQGKNEGMNRVIDAIESGEITIRRAGEKNEYFWWLTADQDINGSDRKSLITYLFTH